MGKKQAAKELNEAVTLCGSSIDPNTVIPMIRDQYEIHSCVGKYGVVGQSDAKKISDRAYVCPQCHYHGLFFESQRYVIKRILALSMFGWMPGFILISVIFNHFGLSAIYTISAEELFHFLSGLISFLIIAFYFPPRVTQFRCMACGFKMYF